MICKNDGKNDYKRNWCPTKGVPVFNLFVLCIFLNIAIDKVDLDGQTGPIISKNFSRQSPLFIVYYSSIRNKICTVSNQ